MSEIEYNVAPKRKPGRPKGAKDKGTRQRRTIMERAVEDMQKNQKVTTLFLQELEKIHGEIEKIDFCMNEYKRAMEQRSSKSKSLTKAIRAMARRKPDEKLNKISTTFYVPADLMHEFNDILDETPLNRNEIFTNLLLNFIKAHKGFSRTDLTNIADGVRNLEKQTYRNTKIASNMLVHAPYDAVRHTNTANTKISAIDNITHHAEYARQADRPYKQDDVIKALEKDGVVDMSDLFGDDE